MGVDQSSKVAEVAHRIREMVHAGTLRTGDALPSTRSLAAQLGVARGTVVAAYDQLDGEGYIRTRQGAAARVVPDVAAGAGRLAPEVASTDGSRGSSPDLSGSASTAATTTPSATGGRVIDLRPGIPAVAEFPLRDWRAAWRAAAAAPLVAALSDPFGSAALRTQIAALGLTRGFATDPSRVIVTAGTSEGLSLITDALRALHGRSPRIAVEDPGYRSGRRAILGSGGELIGVPVTEEGLDLDRLEALERHGGLPDAVMVTPTHQYPLGSVMPVARRRRLLEWASAHQVVVIEDDYDSEFRHRGVPMPALASLDAEGVVLHLGGFSKILDPRLRCAYLVMPGIEAADGIPPDADTARIGMRFADALRRARVARGPVVSEVTQSALAHLMRTGALRRHLGRVRRDYLHRRDRIAARVADAQIPGLEAHALAGGLHTVLTWPHSSAGVGPVCPLPDARELRARLSRHGILVEELATYAVSASTAMNGLVLGYGAASLTQLDRALDLILQP